MYVACVCIKALYKNLSYSTYFILFILVVVIDVDVVNAGVCM